MTELEQLQEQKEQYKKAIEIKNAVERLNNNEDFKKIILDLFCVTECARYVQSSVNINLPAENRDWALQMAQAGGLLKEFLIVKITQGKHAENNMSRLEEEIEKESNTEL